MTLPRALATITGCTLALAVAGGGVGFGIGRLSPGYYRAAVRDGRSPAFDPAEFGFGIGAVQGAAAGMVVGLALVVLFVCRDGWPLRPGWRLARRLAVGVTAVVLFGGCFGSAFLAGLLKGEANGGRQRYEEDRRALEPVLAADPDFSELKVEMWGVGIHGALLSGRVPSPDAYRRLRERVSQVLGSARVEEVTDMVQGGR